MATEQQRGSFGTLYGVGVGPGAPDLLTRRAERVLRECAVVCVPAGTSGRSYAARIIEGLLDHTRQEVLLLQFPMRRDKEQAIPARVIAAEQVIERLHAGLDVAFATEGDPLLYSTFGYLLEIVKARHPYIRIEVIPGVTSVTAAAASAMLPLAAWNERVAILPAVHMLEQSGADDLLHILRVFDTAVLLKVSSVFDALLAVLERLDLVQQATFVRRCSAEHEEIVCDVTTLREQPIDYFSLVIVRNLHATGNS